MVLVAAYLSGPQNASAAVLLNGSFENYDGGQISGNFDFFSENTATGWTDNGVGVYWIEDGAYPNILASDGNHMLTLQSYGNLGSISQTFATAQGQQYEVTFDHSILSGQGTGPATAQELTLQVSVTGNASQNYTLTAIASPPDFRTSPYTTQSYTFTATGTSATLTFANQTVYTGDLHFGTTIDNVAIAAVPEPASAIMLTIVSSLIFFYRRRFRD